MSWLAEEFDSDEKMLGAINKSYTHLHELLMGEENKSLRSLLLHLKEYDLSQINITNDLSLTNISQHLFGRYDVYSNAIKEQLKIITPRKKKETDEEFEDRISKIFKTQKSFSISFLNNLPHPETENGKPRSVEEYFISIGTINTETTQKENLFAQIENAYENVRVILQMKDTGNALSQNKPAVTKIKALLDAFKDLQHFIKPLLGSGEELEKDELFYGSFQMIWDELNTVTPLYNKVRNWLTRKPYSTEKIKLNFDNSQLLGGWDVNKEPDCTGILLRKDSFYYLGIMDKKANRVFETDITPSEGDCYEKMVYKQLGQISQQLPRIAFSKTWQQKLSIPEDVIKIKKNKSFKKNSGDLQKLISYYKSFISQHDEWNSYFDINFTDRNDYKIFLTFIRKSIRNSIPCLFQESHPLTSINLLTRASYISSAFGTKTSQSIAKAHQTCIRSIGKCYSTNVT